MERRILAVEDSPTQAAALCSLLEGAGFHVDLARSGEAALERLGAGSYDLVVSDVVMPGISGYELCRRIKTGAHHDVPVVLLTSLGDPMDIVRGLEAGADNYITKPYDPELLLARVRRVLDSRRLRPRVRTSVGVTVEFLGSTFTIGSDREQILDLLLSSVEDILRANHELEERQHELANAHEQLAEYAREKAMEAQVSTERYRVLMSNASDAIFLLDGSGRILEVNRSAERLLSRGAVELVGCTLDDFVDPSWGDAPRPWSRAIDADSPKGGSTPLLRADGARVHVEFSLSVTRVEETELTLVIGRDVTEQRRVLETLRHSERRLAEAQHIARIGSWEWDLDLDTVRGSEELQRIYGFSFEDCGTRWFDVFRRVIHPDDRARVEELVASVRRERHGIDTEYRIQTPAGETRELHVRGQSEQDGGGRPGRLVGTVQDITERKAADRRLRQSEETLRGIFYAAPVAILSLDREGRVQAWNPAAERVFGWSAEEVIGLPNPVVPPGERDQFEAQFHALLKGSPLVDFETVRLRKDGSPVEVSISATSLRDADGEITGAIAAMTDITERKRTERALRESEEQLRHAQRIEAIGRLTGGIAHDFNNVLTAIKGSTQLLLMEMTADHPLRPELQEIDGAADRASMLTRQLLAFSRKQVMQPEPVDLNATVEAMDRMLKRVMGEAVRLEARLVPGLGPIMADSGQVEQVIMNLVVNARDAMPDGGTVTLETARVQIDGAGAAGAPPPGRYVRLRVVDTGTGMSADVREHIFEPFFTTKEQGKGTGLGLSTVYGIVRQSGGWIHVDSEPGRGTAFTVLFPELDAGVATASRSDTKPQPQGLSGGETVLLVEDEEAVRRLAVRILRRHGYMVIEAANGVEALEAAGMHDGPIDLLLSDVVMPRMGGKELSEALRRQRPGLRVLLMSGYSAEETGTAGAGEALPLLEKPFSPDTFARRVREVLESS